MPLDAELVERLGVQRRVILEQAEILGALGFEDSGVAALASSPETTTPPRWRGRWVTWYLRVTAAYGLLAAEPTFGRSLTAHDESVVSQRVVAHDSQ